MFCAPEKGLDVLKILAFVSPFFIFFSLSRFGVSFDGIFYPDEISFLSQRFPSEFAVTLLIGAQKRTLASLSARLRTTSPLNPVMDSNSSLVIEVRTFSSSSVGGCLEKKNPSSNLFQNISQIVRVGRFEWQKTCKPVVRVT